MSDVIRLTVRTAIDHPIEMDALTPDRLAALGEIEIGALPVWVGSHRASLGEFFTIRGGQSDRVHVEGDLRKVDGIGAGTRSGELLVHGPVGRRVGAGMSGGWIDIRGDAGDEAGLAMRGGALRVTGNAGDRLGAASPGSSRGMIGGEIVVNGSAGAEIAARARRGLVAVGGSAGADAARDIIAGTVVVLGDTGLTPGRGSKRGSIVALGAIAIPSTYAYACTYQPTYVRMLLTHLHRRYGLSSDRGLDGRYARYCGDAPGLARGEILQLLRI